MTAKTVPSSQADLTAVSDLLGDIAAANGEYARAAAFLLDSRGRPCQIYDRHGTRAQFSRCHPDTPH